MRLLALDLGTRCGWCLWTPSTGHTSGVWDLRGGRFEGGGMRFLRFRSMLDSVQACYPLDRIAYEEVRRHLGTDAAHLYGGFQAHLQTWCEALEIPYESIPVPTIKRKATGRGNANKAHMIAAAQAKWPLANITDDNEADARWIAECVVQRGIVQTGEWVT